MGFSPAVTGFFGKLPARGDFVRAGLPEDFVAPWDGWSRAILAASRAALGEAWEPAWMNAPIWRFLLPAGACGPRAVLGVWLPSVDRVGRHFPLALCALAETVPDLAGGGAWLAAAEAAGLAGVVEDAKPAALAAALAVPVADAPGLATGWWTDGSPLVAARRLAADALIPLDFAARMLRDPAPAEPG